MRNGKSTWAVAVRVDPGSRAGRVEQGWYGLDWEVVLTRCGADWFVGPGRLVLGREVEVVRCGELGAGWVSRLGTGWVGVGSASRAGSGRDGEGWDGLGSGR